MSPNDGQLVWSKSTISLRPKAFCYTTPNDLSIHRNWPSGSAAYLAMMIHVKIISLTVNRLIYIVIIAQYLLSVWITEFSFTMNRSLCNSACYSEYILMTYVDFIPLRQDFNTWFISHIHIHKHQFLHVDETQNCRNITVYELIQPEQKYGLH